MGGEIECEYVLEYPELELVFGGIESWGSVIWGCEVDDDPACACDCGCGLREVGGCRGAGV